METTEAKSLRRKLRQKGSETTTKGLERASEILVAARELFARDGYAKLSMRGVAARVGVTLGSVQHYYQTKEALFEAMLEHTLEDLQAAADGIAATHAGSSPADQFRAAMRYFVGELHDDVVMATFAELKARAMRDPFAASVMEKIFVSARKSVGRRIRELVPGVTAKEQQVRSALIIAQLMGLTYLDSGGARRRRADLAWIDDASIELMLQIARRG
jgi:AcrR family transcriptional regulator